MITDAGTALQPVAAMTLSTRAALRGRVHWVIVELDARGEIDAHAAMCLRQAVGDARPGAIDLILVDLRDLAAIDGAGVALFTTHGAECLARGMELGLLISRREGHDQVAEAFVLAGLGHALRYSAERPPPAREPAVRLLERGVRRGPLGRAARRVSSDRVRRARVT